MSHVSKTLTHLLSCIVFLILNVWDLYIVDRTPSSDGWFANVFSKTGLSFQDLSKNRLHNVNAKCIYFCFCRYAYYVISKNSCLTQGHKHVLLCFLLEISHFQVLHLPLYHWVRFCTVRDMDQRSFLHRTPNLFPYHCSKDCFFFNQMFLHPCGKSIDHIYMGLFLNSLLIHWSICLFWPISCYFSDCGFVISFKDRPSSSFVLFFNVVCTPYEC
jgi:hypothetical protein